MEASAATTLDRDNPADVLKAYDQIIEKNKSLTAEVGEGEKALGRQLKEITKLKQEVEDKGQQAAQYHELYDLTHKEKESLKAELDTAKATEKKAQTDITSLRETISSLETRLSDAEAKAASAPPKAKSDDPTTIKLAQELSVQKDANKELSTQLDAAVVEKQGFQTTIQKLNEKCERFSQSSTKLSKDIDHWKTKHHGLEEKISGLEEQNRLISQQHTDDMDQLHQVIKSNKGIFSSIQDKAKNALDAIKSQAAGKETPGKPAAKQLPPRRTAPQSLLQQAPLGRDYPKRDASDASPSSAAHSDVSRTPARGQSAPGARGQGRSRSPRRPRSRSLDRRGNVQRQSSSTAVPPQSIAARREVNKLQDRVPFSFRTPTAQRLSQDPTRKPAYCYASKAKPATNEQRYKAPNRGHSHFIWRIKQESGERKDVLGQWRKGRPRYSDFGDRYSGLYPSLPQDISDYGDGGWRAGESAVPGYRITGPTSQQPRLESHGRLYCFRQPFTHILSERLEKNDWWVERRENRPTYSSHGISGEDSVSSCPDSQEGGSLSPRLRDSIFARYDDNRIEPTIPNTIDIQELRKARDAWGNEMAFDPEGLQKKSTQRKGPDTVQPASSTGNSI